VGGPKADVPAGRKSDKTWSRDAARAPDQQDELRRVDSCRNVVHAPVRTMSKVRTSQTHPLQIAEVRASESHGRIGITFCPGKQDAGAVTGAWARDLSVDLDLIAAWGAQMVLTLIESQELKSLKVPDLGSSVEARGMAWRHLPIADYSIPGAGFETAWESAGREIRALLREGGNVLVHCKGGLGRAGMIAARLLVELGMPPKEAVRTVRRARKGAIETPSQLALVLGTTPIP